MDEVAVEVDPIETIGDDVAEESVQEETPQDAGDASVAETPREDADRDVETDEASEGDAAPAESEEEAEEPSTDTDQQAEKERPAEPFTYQGDGQVHEIAGSTVGEDGSVTVPKDQIPHLKNLLSSGKYFTGSWQREQAAAKQAVEQANAEREAQKARADAIVQKFDELMSLPEDATYEQILQFRQQWPAIQAEAKAAAERAAAEADRERLKELESREQERELLPKLATGLETHMVDFATEERFSGLAREDMQAIYNHLWNSRAMNSVFVQHEGQWYVNKPVVEEAMAYAARFRRQEAAKEEAAEKKQAKAKEDNKSETAKETKKPPPVLRTKGGPQPKGKVEGSVVETIREKYSLEDQTDAIDEWFDNEDFED